MAKPAQGLPDTAASAANALAAGRFKEAVELYKALLKQERRSEWIDALADAYAGRAADLARKGMLIEALALWRTRAQACGRPLHEGPYAQWLLAGGEQHLAFDLLADARLSDDDRARIAASLAPGALAAPEAMLDRIDADSPLRRHRPAALAAVEALARGEPAALDGALQAIAFRSPYRDLRPLLKALADLTAGRPDAASALLERLPAASPFEPLAAVLRAAVQPQPLAALPALPAEAQQLLLDLLGCPAACRSFVLELSRLGAAAEPSALVDLVLRHRRQLPAGTTLHLLRRLLPHSRRQLQACRELLRPRDVAQILALGAEVAGDGEGAEHGWYRFSVECGTATAEDRRAAALALRHIAANHDHPDEPGGLCEDALRWLGRSVELDPDDRDSRLRLVRAWRGRQDLKAARVHLDAALSRFPDDADVLLEAVETALAASSFKKAAGLAKRVLELDPINPRVRSVIGQAHLSHARKHVKAGKPQAAQAEIDEAERWLRTPQERAAAGILRGLAEADAPRSDALLRDAVNLLGAPLAGGFLLALEAERLRHSGRAELRALLQRCGIDLQRTPPAAEVLALARALDAGREPPAVLNDALRLFHDPIARAAAAGFTEADHLQLCETLLRHGALPLAHRCAEAALRRWPRRPVFVFLEAAARQDGPRLRLPGAVAARLDEARDEALDQGDQRTAARIDKLLAERAPPFFADDATPFLPPSGAPPGLPEQLLESLGERGLIDMARRHLGPQFAELRRDLGGDNKTFARRLAVLMVDFFTAEGAAPPPGRGPAAPSDRQIGLFDD